jgi:hypothetical protein
MKGVHVNVHTVSETAGALLPAGIKINFVSSRVLPETLTKK